MKIGILGAGRVAQAFARKAVDAGHDVVFSNRRGPASLAQLVEAFGDKASAATPADAARQPVVLLAVPWVNVEDTLRALPAWRGQILIDPTNAFEADGLAAFDDDSSSEIVARLAPGARVVKAMNTSFMENFEKPPASGDLRRAVFLSGDDDAAANEVADLFESFGLAPVLLGSLKHGGRMQALGGRLAGHDFFLPWPAPRWFPAILGTE